MKGRKKSSVIREILLGHGYSSVRTRSILAEMLLFAVSFGRKVWCVGGRRYAEAHMGGQGDRAERCVRGRGREPVFSCGSSEARISETEQPHLGLSVEGYGELLPYRSEWTAQR